MNEHTSTGDLAMARGAPAALGAGRGSVLTIAFATSVLMWAAAYVGLAPWGGGSDAVIWVLVTVLGLLMAGAGFMAARWTGGGAGIAVKLGLALAGINFIIVASLNGRETTGEALLSGALWIAGFAAAAVVLCVVGALAAGAKRDAAARPIGWTSWFALVVALTTLPLLVSGGIVTGLEAGMAVPDWLTTFDYPMMFYPMVKMQEDTGIYAEHFHRLWGLLVGLSVIALVVQVHRADGRRWMRRLSLLVLGMVIVQGILGGTRVTENNLALAIVHGVFGQAVFATIACVAAACSGAWKRVTRVESKHAAGDIRMVTILAALLLVQLVLGALYRHLHADPGVSAGAGHGILGLHVLLACAVVMVAVLASLRMTGMSEHAPVAARLGIAIMSVVGIQFLLGVGAMVAIFMRGDEATIPVVEVVITTAHQTTGAVLLALAVVSAVWVRRVVAPPPPAGASGSA